MMYTYIHYIFVYTCIYLCINFICMSVFKRYFIVSQNWSVNLCTKLADIVLYLQHWHIHLKHYQTKD